MIGETFRPKNTKEFLAKAVADGFTPHYLSTRSRRAQRSKAQRNGYTLAMIDWLLNRWGIKDT